jgi:hypothetical protein
MNHTCKISSSHQHHQTTSEYHQTTRQHATIEPSFIKIHQNHTIQSETPHVQSHVSSKCTFSRVYFFRQSIAMIRESLSPEERVEMMKDERREVRIHLSKIIKRESQNKTKVKNRRMRQH